jgi:hypothetical protein
MFVLPPSGRLQIFASTPLVLFAERTLEPHLAGETPGHPPLVNLVAAGWDPPASSALVEMLPKRELPVRSALRRLCTPSPSKYGDIYSNQLTAAAFS